MKHKMVRNKASGEGWTVKCACGWYYRAWRFQCEEAWFCHLDNNTPVPAAAPQKGPQPDEFGFRSEEFPNGEFKDEYYARLGDLRYVG